MARFNQKFESEKQDWETPDEIFVPLNKEFQFTLDVCATPENTKCKLFFTEEDNGLIQNWRGICWMNPPFGNQSKWVKKAYEESQHGITTVCLLPARTNTNWWHNYCMKGEVRFIRGRPKFKGAKHGLPQPLAIVIFYDNGALEKQITKIKQDSCEHKWDGGCVYYPDEYSVSVTCSKCGIPKFQHDFGG